MALPREYQNYTIYLYEGSFSDAFRIDQIRRYLKKMLGNIRVKIRQEFIAHHLDELSLPRKREAINSLATKFSEIKIQNPSQRDTLLSPTLGEIEYEKRRILGISRKSSGVLYDGFALQALYYELLPENERAFSHIHIVFTNQLFATWDFDDRRYHARVSVYGFPSLVSVSGLVEAPARPREFYLKKNMGANLVALKREFAGKFIDYDDPRITEVIKGYVMQALFYHLSGDPFCEDKNCRLYNGHWQEEVIHAQLRGDYEFCKLHEELLGRLAKELNGGDKFPGMKQIESDPN